MEWETEKQPGPEGREGEEKRERPGAYYGVVGRGAALCARCLEDLLGGQGRVLVEKAVLPRAGDLRALVLLSLGNTLWEEQLLARLGPQTAVVMNLDEVAELPEGLSAGGRLVTCGLDPRATLTVSSLREEAGRLAVQCCLQRSLPGRAGVWEPQEFGVSVPAAEEVGAVLAAVAAALC